MTTVPPFVIPPEYRDKLEEVAVTDDRSDEEILQTFSSHVPVTSEKNLWAYWDSGIDNAADFLKRNVCDWVRILGSEWTVRVLDRVPGSPNHALKWIPEELLPEAWIKNTFDGPWAGPHSADCLRGALLYLYGGCYADVGSIMLRHLDRVFWKQLEDPASPYEVGALIMPGSQVIGNAFIMSRKGNVFIKLWHDLFMHLWRDGRTSVVGMIDDPLMKFVKYEKMPDTGPKWQWNIPLDRFLEYLTQSACWARLCMLEDAGDGFNAAEYWTKKVLCMEYTKEALPCEEMLGYADTGEKQLRLLSLPVDAPEDVKASEDYQMAYRLVWEMLSDFSIQKLGHGKNIIDDVQLAVLWREHPGMDREPGTFAHLLRYGSVHFRQTRENPKYLEPTPAASTVRRGLLEPPPEGAII